jgi:hypothetical protein
MSAIRRLQSIHAKYQRDRDQRLSEVAHVNDYLHRVEREMGMIRHELALSEANFVSQLNLLDATKRDLAMQYYKLKEGSLLNLEHIKRQALDYLEICQKNLLMAEQALSRWEKYQERLQAEVTLKEKLAEQRRFEDQAIFRYHRQKST